jgi:biotin transport system substrate-specific component
VSTAAVPPFRLPVLADVLPRTRARDAVLVLGAALLTAVLAQVAVPVAGSPVPITGQTLAVVLTAAALGPARGVAGQALYLSLGLLGLPFYSDASGGFDVVAGATGGYLVGFLPAALLIGLAARRGADRRVGSAFALFAAGQLVIFAVGVPWLAVVADLSPAQALEAGFYPFILGGVVKAVLAGVLTPAAWRAVGDDAGRAEG